MQAILYNDGVYSLQHGAIPTSFFISFFVKVKIWSPLVLKSSMSKPGCCTSKQLESALIFRLLSHPLNAFLVLPLPLFIYKYSELNAFIWCKLLFIKFFLYMFVFTVSNHFVS
jgi:hypothetical protein